MRDHIVALILFLFIVTLIFLLMSSSRAEEAWVLCNPESYVILRAGPNKNRFEVGSAVCGTKMETEGKVKNGYLYVYDLAAEEDHGWVSTRYVVYDEPQEVMKEMTIVSQGRVAIRKWIKGKIVKWVKNGDKIKVLWTSNEWSITNKGYIMTKFLSEE